MEKETQDAGRIPLNPDLESNHKNARSVVRVRTRTENAGAGESVPCSTQTMVMGGAVTHV